MATLPPIQPSIASMEVGTSPSHPGRIENIHLATKPDLIEQDATDMAHAVEPVEEREAHEEDLKLATQVGLYPSKSFKP